MYRCGQPYWSLIPPTCPGCPICRPKCCCCHKCTCCKPAYKLDITRLGETTELTEDTKKLIRDCIEKFSKEKGQ